MTRATRMLMFLAVLLLGGMVVYAQEAQPAPEAAPQQKEQPNPEASPEPPPPPETTPAPEAEPPAPAAAAEAKPPYKASAIQVLDIRTKDVQIPAQFAMALYENLVDELQKTGRFEHVYRDGEKGAESVPDLVTLTSTVWGFKEGSARQRQVTTVSGATVIKVHVNIANRSGQMLVDKDVEGSVHFFGENLRATYNFAKNVAGVVKTDFNTDAK